MSISTDTDLRTLAARGSAALRGASAAEVVAWTADTFGDRFVVASNMQDAVLVHLVAQARPGVDVLFLDTGYHFAETIDTRDAVAQTYGVNIVTAQAELSVAEQDQVHGKDLFAREPDRCCAMRKVAPLRAGLAGYDAWVTGVRRVESPTRADTPLVSYDETFQLLKVNPLAAWSDEAMHAYITEHSILVNMLVDAGYPSIGCAPCTAKPLPGADARSGRWAGRAKTECGLHQ